MIWLSCVCLPLAMGLAALHPKTAGLVSRLLVVATFPALTLCLAQDPGPSQFSSLLLGTRFGFSDFGRAFLFPTVVVWGAAALFTPAYLAQDRDTGRFAFFFLLTMTGNIGLIVVRDLASFYAFFALMTYAAYGLIIHDRSGEALHAGRVYMIMSLLGEAGVIAAVVLVVSTNPGVTTGDVATVVAVSQHTALILLSALLGFGVKAGAFLLHFWLPLAHPAAPVPASAVLSGCMIKAGLLGWLYFVPMQGNGFPLLGGTIILFGLAALFFGVLAGLVPNRPKTILAFSSISQMGLMTLCLGLGVTAPGLWPMLRPVLLLLILTHALAKGGLFLLCGTATALPAQSLSGRLLLASGAILGLVLAGFPLTGGAVVKAGLKHTLHASTLPYVQQLEILLTASAVGTMLLLGRFLFRLRSSMPLDAHRPPALLWLPCTILLLAAVFAPLLHAVTTGSIPNMFIHSGAKAWQSAWPVLLGIGLSVFVHTLQRESGLELPWPHKILRARVASGISLFFRFSGNSLKKVLTPMRMDLAQLASTIADQDTARTLTGRIERRLMHWHTVGLVIVLMLVVFLILTVWTV